MYETTDAMARCTRTSTQPRTSVRLGKLRCLQAHCSHVFSNECEGAAEYGVLKAAKYFNHLRNMGCTTQDQYSARTTPTFAMTSS
jgi:hypothetical protein